MAVGCGAKCAKFLLIVFNLIFWLSGGALMGIGIWLIIDKENTAFLDLLEISVYDPMLRYAAYLLIGVGFFVFLVGFLGCCGAIQEVKALLVAYFILLLLVLAAEVAAGILAFVYKKDVEENVRGHLLDSIKNDYGRPEKKDTITRVWDEAQLRLKCCGANKFMDYTHNSYLEKDQVGLVPRSCCKLDTEGSWDKPIYQNLIGCVAGEAEAINRQVSCQSCAFSSICMQLRCCGVDSPADYFPSNYTQSKLDPSLPISCCVLDVEQTPYNRPADDSHNTGTCQQSQEANSVRNNPDIYQTGCADSLAEWFKQHTNIVIGVGLGIAALEIFGMIFSIILCRHIGNDD